MDEETLLASEETSDPVAESTATPDEAEAAETGDGTVTEETVSLTVQETIQAVGSDIVHVNLFGSFLVCGTLIGLALLRKVYGT